MYNKREIGSHYEDVACDYLKKNGYKVIEKNFFCRQGEIDIVAKDKDYIVFIEVKYRKDSKTGYPKEAVNYYKKNKIIRVARYYLYKKRYSDSTPVRFDVISIEGSRIEIIKDAFWLN